MFFPTSKTKSEKLCFTNRSLFEMSTHEQALAVVGIIKRYIPVASSSIVEGSAGVGGNTYAFAKSFESITAVELGKLTARCLDTNTKILGLTNVSMINDNFIAVMNEKDFKYDVAFFDPPWGGIDYKKSTVELAYEYKGDRYTMPEIAADLLDKVKLIVFKTPININEKSYEKTGWPIMTKFVFKSHKKRPLYLIIVLSKKPMKKYEKTEDRIKTIVRPAGYKFMKYSVIGDK